MGKFEEPKEVTCGIMYEGEWDKMSLKKQTKTGSHRENLDFNVLQRY